MIARDFNRHPMRMDRDGCSNATRTATLLGTTRDGEKGRVGLSSQVREPTVADRTEGRPPAIMTWAFGAGALTGPTRRPQEKGSKTRNQTTPDDTGKTARKPETSGKQGKIARTVCRAGLRKRHNYFPSRTRVGQLVGRPKFGPNSDLLHKRNQVGQSRKCNIIVNYLNNIRPTSSGAICARVT